MPLLERLMKMSGLQRWKSGRHEVMFVEHAVIWNSSVPRGPRIPKLMLLADGRTFKGWGLLRGFGW